MDRIFVFRAFFSVIFSGMLEFLYGGYGLRVGFGGMLLQCFDANGHAHGMYRMRLNDGVCFSLDLTCSSHGGPVATVATLLVEGSLFCLMVLLLRYALASGMCRGGCTLQVRILLRIS